MTMITEEAKLIRKKPPQKRDERQRASYGSALCNQRLVISDHLNKLISLSLGHKLDFAFSAFVLFCFLLLRFIHRRSHLMCIYNVQQSKKANKPLPFYLINQTNIGAHANQDNHRNIPLDCYNQIIRFPARLQSNHSFRRRCRRLSLWNAIFFSCLFHFVSCRVFLRYTLYLFL